MSHVAIKFCGLRDEATVQHAISLMPQGGYVGFVHFPPSPRFIELEQIKALSQLLPENITPVIVLVDPSNTLLETITQCGFRADTHIQLHGEESPHRVEEIRTRFLKTKLIKALAIDSISDMNLAKHYTDHSDMLLFDAKPPAQSALPGGNGISFDWMMLKKDGWHERFHEIPWLLAGGLTSENVGEAVRFSGAHLVDVSSSLESAPGVKDLNKMSAFARAVQELA